MTDQGRTAPPGATYTLAFLTEEWVWEDAVEAPRPDEAIASARDALETVVREERPELACVTVLAGDRKLGVWDHVAGQYVWTAAG